MSDYNKATNFTAKDTLPTGNAGKIVKGAEIDTELTAVSSAIASKANINSPTFTGTPAAPTASADTNTTQLATTAFVIAERTNTSTLTNKTLTSPTISGGSISGITDLAVADGGTGRSTLTANAVLVGNGTSGINSVAPSTSGNVLTSDGTSWTSAANINYVKAWVNFDGTGTVAIRGSYNVSSITDNGTGDYTINFTTAMPNTNYATVASCGQPSQAKMSVDINVVADGPVSDSPPTVNSFRIYTSNYASTYTDSNYVSVAVLSS
jgi:hypothetical protein